jgi:selenocysteine lyase/cysteine desulfurase
MVRSGLLCAHPLFEALRRPDGVLRASAYVYNSLDDVRTCAARCGSSCGPSAREERRLLA